MSRIGKKPISLPKGVSASMGGDVVSVKGPKGELQLTKRPEVGVNIGDAEIGWLYGIFALSRGISQATGPTNAITPGEDHELRQV